MLTLVLALALTEAPPPRVVGELMELTTPTGTLFGTLDLPDAKGPWPVVLLHAGSGPTNRDGNGPLTQNNALKFLGRALATKGIAVVRIDKRGMGASAKAMTTEEDIRLETYAADVSAWVAKLRKDSRFTKVAIAGHSEGSLICLIAAKESKPDAVVSLCGPGRPFQDVLREQLKVRTPKELFEKCEAILKDLEAGKAVTDVPAPLAALFRPSVQPFLIAAFKHDPPKLLATYPGPVLVVSGTTDIQVSVADGERLAGGKPGVKHVVLKDMNHVLKVMPQTEMLLQLPTYRDATLPLHPKLTDEVAGFLLKSLGK
jgi:pimeloyl-ACP methyl ester carboxylesterase